MLIVIIRTFINHYIVLLEAIIEHNEGKNLHVINEAFSSSFVMQILKSKSHLSKLIKATYIRVYVAIHQNVNHDAKVGCDSEIGKRCFR